MSGFRAGNQRQPACLKRDRRLRRKNNYTHRDVQKSRQDGEVRRDSGRVRNLHLPIEDKSLLRDGTSGVSFTKPKSQRSNVGPRKHCDIQRKGPTQRRQQKAQLTDWQGTETSQLWKQPDRQTGQVTKNRFAAGIEWWKGPNKGKGRKPQAVVGRHLAEQPPPLASQIKAEQL